MHPPARLVIVLFVASAAVIAGVWGRLGMPVTMPHAPLGAGDKLPCVSYAPFHGAQTPLDFSTRIEASQIERDLAQLARITDCVRTYSVDYGLDQIAAIAARHKLRVIQGLWLSSKAERNREQIETAVALADRYRDTIEAVVVGNEVLLRGEMSAADLLATLREVKSRVPVPVTYADVWEFWLRNRELAAVADFVTIHILPYWEDFPIAAAQAAAHVDAIRAQVAAAFPGKAVLIGEVGWPSAGRMREGALPSPVNQARVLQDVLAAARLGHYRVNLIEAFDQPWKRALEGTVGGHWGLLDDATRTPKFVWGTAVSNHPAWRWQAAGGIAFAALVFVVAWLAQRRAMPTFVWLAVAGCATSGGAFVGWTVENVPLESLGIGGWLRSLAFAAVAFTAPPLAAAMLTRGAALPPLAAVLNRGGAGDRLTASCGTVVASLTVIATVVALGLVFDPRYHDFPFAPLTAAVLPLALLGVAGHRSGGARGAAETAAAALLAVAAVYIAINEGLANWQALWLAATLIVLAFTLVRVRGAPG